ncbi:right-handed parallel beta-helix repeat-containing protein [Akkermansiaceae bacterium]|nr:right-handed parallel beta-helix repeat-containing protein [Akkermansiaceae bacterium]MDB4537864.1 right-handed parallel beta-helix repeat-containing protein [Akkermansiaceae bacterium]
MSEVTNFGATGDGKTDDTAAIQHAINDGDGLLIFPKGTYRITKPLEITLAKTGSFGISGSLGTATIVMEGAGPAIRLIGNHEGTGDPGSVKPVVWKSERMPQIREIAIEGAHPEADGIELTGTMQTIIDGVMIRNTRHGIHLVKRNRNVHIVNCHIYHNHGAGIFLDGLNLHQINIATSHISYNRLGGIRIERSEVRNLQITGNDIEYNNAPRAFPKLATEPTAEIRIDTTTEGASVNEVTIASNTIQATSSKAGCNIRIMEKRDTSRPPGLITITGNIIGSQENNIHLTNCYGVAISGNSIYSGTHRNLLVEGSSMINVGNNHFRRHTPGYGTGVRFTDSRDCTITGCGFLEEANEKQKSGASLLELSRCERIAITGCTFTNGLPFNIDAKDCHHTLVTGCTLAETRAAPLAKASINFSGKGSGNMIASSSVQGNVAAAPSAGLSTK